MRKASYFVGIDLHKSVIQVCVLDASGDVFLEKRFLGESLDEGLAVVKELTQWKAGRFAVEAVGMNRWFVDACREAGLDIVVVDPGKLNLKMLGRKTDRRDAYEIARRLYLGDIDKNAKTYYATGDEYAARKLLRTRHKLVSLRQQVVNQIRAALRAHRIDAPSGRLYDSKNMRLLGELEMPHPDLGAVLGALLANLRCLQASIQELTARIERRAQDEPQVAAAIETLPSMGPQTAVTLIYELGDVNRFKGTRSVGCYAGLVPRVSQSADKSHHGRLTKRGNPELRWILTQWAVRLMYRDPMVQEWVRPQLKRKPKNKIRIALARRLLMGVYVMLRTGEDFSIKRCLAA